MKSFFFRSTLRASTATAMVAFVLFAGCKKAPVDDATLTANVHAALTGDSAIATEAVQPSVVDGVVTLNGNVSNDTARMVASQDAAKVAGVKQVINNLTIQGLAVAPTISTPDAPTEARVATKQERVAIAQHKPLPPPPSYYPSAPHTQTTSAPPPPPAPVYRNINVPPGTPLSVRINQTLDSATTEAGASFSGIVSSTVIVGGEVAIPAGSSVSGRVLEVHEAGHFKGSSLLTIELTGIRRRGESIALSTEPYSVQGKGRGVNTAEKVGGGAAVGAIIGGIFGGGKGAAIGAGAGGGLGAGAQAVTRGQQVQIPSESIVRFRLANPITVRSMGRSDEEEETPTGLQQRQPY